MWFPKFFFPMSLKATNLIYFVTVWFTEPPKYDLALGITAKWFILLFVIIIALLVDLTKC